MNMWRYFAPIFIASSLQYMLWLSLTKIHLHYGYYIGYTYYICTYVNIATWNNLVLLNILQLRGHSLDRKSHMVRQDGQLIVNKVTQEEEVINRHTHTHYTLCVVFWGSLLLTFQCMCVCVYVCTEMSYFCIFFIYIWSFCPSLHFVVQHTQNSSWMIAYIVAVYQSDGLGVFLPLLRTLICSRL